jgi:hypothetical protein
MRSIYAGAGPFSRGIIVESDFDRILRRPRPSSQLQLEPQLQLDGCSSVRTGFLVSYPDCRILSVEESGTTGSFASRTGPKTLQDKLSSSKPFFGETYLSGDPFFGSLNALRLGESPR